MQEDTVRTVKSTSRDILTKKQTISQKETPSLRNLNRVFVQSMYRPRNFIQWQGKDFVLIVYQPMRFSPGKCYSFAAEAQAAESNLPPLCFGSFEPFEIDNLLAKAHVDDPDLVVRPACGFSAATDVLLLPCVGKPCSLLHDYIAPKASFFIYLFIYKTA